MNFKRALLSMTLVTTLFASLPGCATLFAGGPDRIQVASAPPGAKVFLDNQEVGATPMVVTLDRERSGGNIRLEAPGYQPATFQRVKSVQGVFWLNLCAGLLGFIVDLATGDYKAFDTSAINVSLIPAQGAPEMAPPPAGQTAPAPEGDTPARH